MPEGHDQKSHERGAALLSVLMIVAIMSVAAIVTLDTLSRSVSLTKMTGDRSRAVWAVRSLEAYTYTVVDKLGETVGEGFTENELEALEPQTIPMPDGVVVAQISEETNCFNLNALKAAENEDIDPVAVATYRDLLIASDFGRYEAQALADTLADWMDSDPRSRVNGAEDGYYASQSPPYRTSGQLLENKSELNAIAGYTPEIRQRISRLVCVRPATTPSTLNLNTLTEDQAPLLMTLFSKDMTKDDALSVIQARPPGGWENMAEFNDTSVIKTISPLSRNADSVSLKTTHVRLRASYQTNSSKTNIDALYEWSATGAPRLIWRRYGGRS